MACSVDSGVVDSLSTVNQVPALHRPSRIRPPQERGLEDLQNPAGHGHHNNPHGMALTTRMEKVETSQNHHISRTSAVLDICRKSSYRSGGKEALSVSPVWRAGGSEEDPRDEGEPPAEKVKAVFGTFKDGSSASDRGKSRKGCRGELETGTYTDTGARAHTHTRTHKRHKDTKTQTQTNWDTLIKQKSRVQQTPCG